MNTRILKYEKTPRRGRLSRRLSVLLTVAAFIAPVFADSREAVNPSENPIASSSSEYTDCPRVFLTTNLLYDALLTPNIGVGVYLGKKMYAWWSNRGQRRYWRIYGGDLELRMQLGHGRSGNPLSGHHVGLYFSIVTYDFQFGRSHTGVMGDKFNYAAGISYGYSLPLNRRLSLDFSAGIGYAWGKYMKQRLIDDHDVWLSTHRRRWFGPTRAEVCLTWLLGRGNMNTPKTRKGGEL